MVKEKGKFVISLDFELMWGNPHEWASNGYGKSNVTNVKLVVEKLIALFELYNIRATFATVGLIMKDPKEGDLLPYTMPSYKNKDLIISKEYIYSIPSDELALFFNKELVCRLKKSDNIEIATHTYTHYYCWEEGQNLYQFEEDVKKAVEVANSLGITLKSIVFPRNQFSEDYLSVCCKYGITSYRGNARKFFNHTDSKFKNCKNKICRLLDAYFNVGGNTSYILPDRNAIGTMSIQNIPASRFLRPYSRKLAFVDFLKYRRIQREMKYAARKGQIYHIWWHPHNFGNNINENLSFLEKILKYYQYCNMKYGMESMSMSDIISNEE